MALVKSDGTAIAKSPGNTVLEDVTEPDPLVKVKIDVYRTSPYSGAEFGTQMKQIAFRTGDVIRKSQWTREFKAPEIDTVSPATGAAAGGTVVRLRGRNFTADAAVTIGGTAATGVTVESETELRCTTPAHSAGAVNVVVTTAGGTATKTGGFTYA